MIRTFPRILPWLLLAGVLHASDGAAPAMNHFALSAYQQLAQGQSNVIFSPYSIASALSMALVGARGQTAAEMDRVLHAVQPAELATLVDQLDQSANTGGNQLHSANGLWVQRGFPLVPGFQKTILTDYRAPLSELDFAGDPEQARAAINSWTEQHTHGKIQNLFGPGSLNGSIRLVLTSAVYFYGKWQSPFSPEATRPAAFHLLGGATAQTSFMNLTGTFGYGETPEVQILEMKYAGTPIVFDIILPKSASGITEVEKSLTPEQLAALFGNVPTGSVEVSIPKFRADSQFSLGEVLARMGMSTAFTNRADFSGIDGRRDLLISAVQHKAFVDVSEEGTEAAAATGIAVARVKMAVVSRPVFRADHPFLFFIRDSRSGLLLFAGRFMRPA